MQDAAPRGPVANVKWHGRVIDQLIAFVAVMDREGRLLDVDANALSLAGLTRAEVIGRPMWETYWWSHDEAERTGLREAVAAAREGSVVRRRAVARLAGDGRLPVLYQVAPARDPSGALAEIVISAVDLTEQHAAETQLARKEERLATALKAGRLGVFDYDPRTTEVGWDEAIYGLFALTPGTPLTYGEVLAYIHPDDREILTQDVARALDPAGEGLHSAVVRIRRADGEERWVRAHGRTTFEGGEAVRLVGTVQDISAQKENERQRELLIHELHHRVKNLFAVVSGLVGMTARRAASVKEMETTLRSRIGSLARAHDLIRPAVTGEGVTDRRVVLADVVSTIVRPHVGMAAGAHAPGNDASPAGAGSVLDERIAIAGPTVELRAEAATSLALVLHELTTNAAKYGALSEPTGRLTIEWSLADGALLLNWRERAVAARADTDTDAASATGFGTALMRLAVEGRLAGTLTSELTAAGYETFMRLPLARLVP